jgi:CheY-like chemotaxis protein
MIIGEKESFFIKVLVKKIIDSSYQAFYVPDTLDTINQNFDRADIVVYYMEPGEVIGYDIERFLIDSLQDKDKKIIFIGDPKDTKPVCAKFPSDVIYRELPRPLDNEHFMEVLSEFFRKSSMGELKKSILICDDDPNYLGLVREWLKDTYKVAAVTSGLQAIKWLGKNNADLILLDHEMPVTTGPQVLEMLRADEETRNIPVMFLTGKSDKESVMAVVSLKPEGYFLKNIEKNELLGKLKEFFALR